MNIPMDRSKGRNRISQNWRIGVVIICIACMIFTIGKMALSGSEIVIDGKADLSRVLYDSDETIALNGQWEFYWNQLLTPADFTGKQLPNTNALMKVPGAWGDKKNGVKSYPNQGVATYRLRIDYPQTLKDPALRIQNVAMTYKLYANGQLITEVGKISDKASEYKEDDNSLILDLPKDDQELELIIQVANLNYASGGLRVNPIFGSKEALTQHKAKLLAIQLFFIGSVFIFGAYYLLLFILNRKNKTALLFSILCIITAVRSSIWGEAPVEILFPYFSTHARAYINYLTGYNLLPILALFILSLYPLGRRKTIWGLFLIPMLLFDLLLLTPPGFMSLFTNYLYILVLIQMTYIIAILTKAVLLKKENGILMFITICIFFVTIIQDILYYKGIGGGNVAYTFLFGKFAIIMAMSFVQAKKQENVYKKLILFNEKLIETDRLKDKIMATETSFLQAQIKPHFLYNALNAIANVCEKDGKKASKLIIDLAIYLRGSLEFNHLDKMTNMEKELEFVDTYFNIEQARFGKKIQLLRDINSPLDFKMPVLILQPLVENAVRHGISKRPRGGTIRIKILQTDGEVCIEIKDDGIGMDAKKLEMILTEERLEQGVGLLNIQHRLQRLYGRGLEIMSEEGVGTCVKFIIPRYNSVQ